MTDHYIFIDPEHGDQFMECGECNRKPGAPVMCRACLHNRDLVAKYKNQTRILKEQLSIYKRTSAEYRLVAGRYQYLFEEAMKAVNKVDDLFEYVYASMHQTEIRSAVMKALDNFTEAVAKYRRSPADGKRT